MHDTGDVNKTYDILQDSIEYFKNLKDIYLKIFMSFLLKLYKLIYLILLYFLPLYLVLQQCKILNLYLYMVVYYLKILLLFLNPAHLILFLQFDVTL